MSTLKTKVEQKAAVVCLKQPVKERVGVGISHLAYEIQPKKRVWTAVGNGRGFATDEQTNLRTNALGDVFVVDIKRWAEKMTRIVNIYDQ
jgi:hypothetical protein